MKQVDERLSEFREWLREEVLLRKLDTHGDREIDVGHYLEADFILGKFDERFGA